MSDEELLESLDHHFKTGNLVLTTRELRLHQRFGFCPDCRPLAAHAIAVAIAADGPGDAA